MVWAVKRLSSKKGANMFNRIIMALALALSAAPALAFEVSFSWEGLSLCTSGNPNNVTNPSFTLESVPEGTKFIRFRLTDRDVPGYNHGGGVVPWNGEATVPPGMFNYKSPCPPNGVHTYEWTATAMTKKNGGKLGEARAQRQYPE